MPILFQSAPGSVVQLDETGVQCTTQLLGLPDANITFEAQRSIITRVVVSQQVNVQFLHTLGALVYIYVFGDRMGQVTLSGLSFACTCPDDTLLGAEQMLLWYRTNRASNRAFPIRVLIGNYVIEGFVTGVTEDVVDPTTSLVQWGVTINALPDDDGIGGQVPIQTSTVAPIYTQPFPLSTTFFPTTGGVILPVPGQFTLPITPVPLQ
jgi:hypothetical protein